MNYKNILSQFEQYKESMLSGRYLAFETLQKLISNLPSSFKVRVIGESVHHIPIYAAYWGNGDKKILAWSQMHGNETTTTKALFDLVRFLDLEKNTEFVSALHNNCQMVIVFVLNPDGAIQYTRSNANHVDLNRDAKEVTQPEMKALQQLFKEVKPNLCLNLHGQRTLFSAGLQPQSASLSFLSPSVNATRALTSARINSMKLINEINTMLQKFIPGQVGRYDDGFNPNCIGDHFQSLGTPTILFEAGHITNDYQREETRKFILLSYIKVLQAFALEEFTKKDHSFYFDIPQNQKLYFDYILRNVVIDKKKYDLAIQYEEVLKDKMIHFIPKLTQINQLENFYAHCEINVSNQLRSINGEISNKLPSKNTIIEEICTDDKIFALKKLKL